MIGLADSTRLLDPDPAKDEFCVAGHRIPGWIRPGQHALSGLISTSALGKDCDLAVKNRLRQPSRVPGPRDPLKLSAEWRQSTILKMVLCAEWRQLQEWRRLAEDNPHGHEIIRLMQVRGDRERQPPADVGTACGNMTNLHVLRRIY